MEKGQSFQQRVKEQQNNHCPKNLNLIPDTKLIHNGSQGYMWINWVTNTSLMVAQALRKAIRPVYKVKYTLLQRNENSSLHKNLTQIFSDFIQNCQKLETSRCSSGEKGQKLRYVHTVAYCSAIKRNKPLIHLTWMNLKGTYLNEISQSKKVTCCKSLFTWHLQCDRTVRHGKL